MKIQQPIGKQTLMKSNAQLQRDDSDDEVPIPAAMPVGFPDMASSSQTVPPPEPEINFSQIMEALAAIHGAVHHFYTAGGAFHKQAGRAESAGSPGVPQVPSSWQ